jgi:hypothetical protein
MPRILRPQWGAAVLIVEMHELFQHPHEGAASARFERRQNQTLRRRNGRLDVVEQATAERGDVKGFRAPIERAVAPFDEPLLFQAGDHVTDSRAVESNDIAKRRLIDARMVVDGENSGILDGRDVEFPRLIHENGKGNLLQSANEMAGRLVEMSFVECRPTRTVVF